MSSALRNPWILKTVNALINPQTGSEIGQSGSKNCVTQVIDADETNVGLILLSDKRHFIWARLSEKCVQKLRNERSRLSASFSSLKGALLSVPKFTVCMNFLRDSPDVCICEYSLTNALRLGYAGRSLALHLRVEEVDLLGCDSLTICGKPKNVCSDPEVIAVMRRTSPELLHRKLVKLQFFGNTHKCPQTLPLPLFGQRISQRYDICSTTQFSEAYTPEDNEDDVSRAFGPPAEVTFETDTIENVVDTSIVESESKTQASTQAESQSSVVSNEEILNTQAFINTQHNDALSPDDEDDKSDCNGGTCGIPTQAFLSSPKEHRLPSEPFENTTADERGSSAKNTSGRDEKESSSNESRARVSSLISINSDTDSDEENTVDNSTELRVGQKQASTTKEKPIPSKAQGPCLKLCDDSSTHTDAAAVRSASIQARRVLAKAPTPSLKDQTAQTFPPVVVSKDVQTSSTVLKDSTTQTRPQLCDKAVQTEEIRDRLAKVLKPKAQVAKKTSKRKFSQLNLNDITWVASYFTRA